MSQQEITAKSLIHASFSAFFSNFVPLVTLVVVATSPSIAWQAYTIFGVDLETLKTTNPQKVMELSGISILLSMLVYPISAAMLTYGIFQIIRGQQFTIGKCFEVGLARMFPVIGIGMVSGILIMLGFLCFIIPGLVLICMYFIVTPVCVVEKKGVMESLARSKELMHGYKKIVLNAALGIGIIAVIFSVILGLVVTTMPLGGIVQIIESILFGAVLGILPVLTYYELRKSKESADLEELASVFD